MRIENNGARGLRRDQLSKDYRPASRDRQQVRLDAARFEHLAKVLRIFLDIWRVARHIWDGEKFRELPDDPVLVVQTIVAHFLNKLSRRNRNWFLPHRWARPNGSNQNNREESQEFSPLTLSTTSLSQKTSPRRHKSSENIFSSYLYQRTAVLPDRLRFVLCGTRQQRIAQSTSAPVASLTNTRNSLSLGGFALS